MRNCGIIGSLGVCGFLLLLSCSSGTAPSQPDLDTIFTDTLTTAASVLTRPNSLRTDTLNTDSLYLDSTEYVVTIIPPDSALQLEEPEQ